MLAPAVSQRTSTILVAEDNPADVFILHQAFSRAGRDDVSLRFMCDGVETINYLAGIDKFRDRKSYPLPCLLLLDLKMPRMDGFAVLEWLQGHRAELDIPVVVLTGSEAKADIDRAHAFDMVVAFYPKQGGVAGLPTEFERLRARFVKKRD